MKPLKKLFFIITSAFIASTAFTQADTTMRYNDTLIIVTSYEYDLNYGMDDKHKKVLEQLTYSTSKQLRREIYFNPATSKISGFTYFFYNKNGEIESEEVYYPDGNINYIVEYTYASEQILTKTIYNLKNNSLSFSGDTTYKYKTGNLALVISRDSQKKKTSKLKFKYSNKTTSSLLKIYPGTQQVTKIKSAKTTEVYNNDTLINKEIVEIFNNGESVTTTITYRYKNQKLSEKTIKKSDSDAITKYEFDYYADGQLRNEIIYKGDSKERHLFIKKEQIVMNYAGYNCVLYKYKDKMGE
ncbi:MAG: hypothetical protein JXA77_01065 [Bacteroidales bacterium]|nr:hypothetical protein [Bacteroidales bacterium]MBN2818386.1 hypothetical protein [Bacteroidales bacterium]